MTMKLSLPDKALPPDDSGNIKTESENSEPNSATFEWNELESGRIQLKGDAKVVSLPASVNAPIEFKHVVQLPDSPLFSGLEYDKSLLTDASGFTIFILVLSH